MDVHILEVFLVVGCVLGFHADELGCAHDTVADEHCREELILGTHPFELVLDFLLVVAALPGVLHIATLACKLVVDGAVALLELLTELMARDLLVPIEVHKIDVQRDDASHVLLHHLHAHHVAAGDEGVFQAPLGATLKFQIHQQGAVVKLLGLKEEVLGLEALGVIAQGEAVIIVTLVEEHQLRRVPGLVAFQRST